MAWPMPTTGQWTPGMAVTPDVNMGSYTPEQWAAVQQQNWQQWAQWQQQYASWQSQYGSKYAEQMQAIQTMNAMPPLPPASAAPPPAPPPPDKPPPPPHENNQPLYGHTPQQQQQQTISVSAAGQNNAPSNNNTDTSTGNNQNRSYATDVRSEATLSSVNTEALKSLAEEEKAFDIQFQKWEEEIDKWKKANENHPDKKAYEEYEQRFESCRARLLDRRQQMKQRRAKLMDTTQQTPSSAPRRNLPTNPQSQHPPAHNSHSDKFNTTKEQPNNSFPSQSFNKNYSQNSQYNNNMPQQDYYRGNNHSYDPQDRHESYSNTRNNNYSNHLLIPTEPFLPTTEPSKGIPGLDLVPEAEKLANKAHDVIDITEDSAVDKHMINVQQGPDYSKISKGINNILGDEKIMNILSMVRGQNQPPNQTPQNNQGSYGTNAGSNLPNNYWNRDESHNDNNYGMSQNNMPYIKPQHNDYSMNQNNSAPPKYVAPATKQYDERQDAMQQDQFYERNQQYTGQGLLPRPGSGMQQNMRPNVPMRSLLDPIQHPNEYPNSAFDRRGVQNQCEPHPPPNQGIRPTGPVRPPQPVRPSWVDEPLFAPSIIVEYEHKPLRLKARDFIEPVHTFDYNHQSKEGEGKKKDFEKEVDELFVRNPRMLEKEERYTSDRYSRDLYYRDYERREHLRDIRDDQYPRGIRDDDRRRYDDDVRDRRFDDRRRDDRDKYIRREDIQRERDRDRDEMYRDRNRERDFERNRDRDRDRDLDRNKDRDRGLDQNREMDRDRDRHRDYRRSRSHDKDSRKRGHSKESNSSSSKKSKETPASRPAENPKHLVMIDDILELPGRQMRPEKIVIILRGPPGSGKSYLAKLIRDREAEHGGTVRVMSIDDYFMQEGEMEEKDPTTGKIVKKPSLKYEYDEKLEETYLFSLKRAFKRSLTDGFFTFLIYDAVNDQLRSYADIWNFARQNNFQVYICTMELDPQACFKRNIHNRKLEDIEVICSRFFPTPSHHIQLDPTTLLQTASIPEVQMEDADDDVTMEDAQEPEVNNSFTSKWEKMDDAAQLARLDGTSKPLRPSQLSMEDYLQLDDWKPNVSKPGKKTVRWADIEERRQQEKMRAIGFVVGQTDWNRMTDPTMGSSALTQTKYIERVRRT